MIIPIHNVPGMASLDHSRPQSSDEATSRGKREHSQLHLILITFGQNEMLHAKGDELLEGVAGRDKLFLCLVECPGRLTSLLVSQHESIEWPKVRCGMTDSHTGPPEACRIRSSVEKDFSAETVTF